MIIYPDIELHNGKCVNLKQGSISEPIVFEISPLQAAKEFEQAGAQWLHLIDLDAAFGHANNNAELIREIIQQANIPVQVGGGIGSQSVIESWFDDGAARVVLGTAAIADPKLVNHVCAYHPEKILISIDARNGKAVSHGWQTVSSIDALELAKRFEQVGAGGIIYTDIDLYDELPEASMANTIEMASQLKCPVISSGTIKCLDDVSMLSQLPNISGVVTGRALFNKAITLQEALQIANQKRTVAALI